MLRKLLIAVVFMAICSPGVFAQIVFEYEECDCDNTIYPESRIKGEKKGVVIVYSEVNDLRFEMYNAKSERLLDVKHKEGKYILILEPMEESFRKAYGKYDILIKATGFQEKHIYVKNVNPGSMCSFCCILRSPTESPKEKLARITVYDKDYKLLVGAEVKNKTTGYVYGTTRSDGTIAVGFDKKGEMTNVIVSHPSYSDTKEITVEAGVHDYKVYLRNYNPPTPLDQYEKVKYRLYIPFAYPMGNFGKGSDNWMEGGNAWSNYPFDLAYFFEDNRSLTKAAMSMGFGLGTKAIIPLKKSTTAIMVQAEYLLLLSNSGKISSGQAVPAEVLYYQYNPSSGLNNVKVLETNMNFTFPRLNTMDVMLGMNKKFRNIIGTSHLELEGAMGAAWHWSSDFKGQSTTSGEYNFVANYDIFSGTPSLAFEVGVAMTLGSHLSLGLNYVYLGGFDVKGHANWNSTVVQNSDANINNVDFHFGHVTVHYLSLILSYSVQHK